MVNPLMSSKQEPFSGICSEVLGVGPTSSTSVKLELDPSENGDEEDTKIEVKMEVLEEFFGLGFGGHSIDMDSKDALIGSESLLMPLGPPPTYPGEQGASSAPGPASLLAPSVKTVKVPLSSQMSDMSDSSAVFPPVLSIPCSVSPAPASFSLSSPVSGARPGLHIAVSPARGPDTTTLTSPPPSSASSLSANKKTIFTAKGLLKMSLYKKTMDSYIHFQENNIYNMDVGGFVDFRQLLKGQ